VGNNTSEENKTFAMSFLNTESPQNETSHELPNPVYHSISQFPHAFIRLGKIVQEISPILYPQDSNGKRGERPPFPVVWFFGNRRGETDFGGSERPTCLSWSEAEHSSRQPRRIQANMAAAAGPHLQRRRQRQRLLTEGGERRRATATAGEEREGG